MLKSLRWNSPVASFLLAAGLTAGPIFCVAADKPSTDPPTAPADSGLYIKVQLANPVKMSKLKPADVVEGSLSRDVYSAERKLFPAGSQVRLTVDHLEKRKRPRNDHWPWVVNAFTPRHQNYPVFKTATVALAAGESTKETSLQVSVTSVTRLREVHAQAKKGKPGQPPSEHGAVEVSHSNVKPPATLTMVLEASSIDGLSATENNTEASSTEPASPRPDTIPAGTQCKILLLGKVSASRSKPGDVVQARLLEPVLLNSIVVLPAGSLFEGKVVKKTPPRWLSRAGSLYLTFTEVTLPEGGGRFPVTASLAGAELDRRSHTRIDSEGQLRGERPGKAWMAINLAVTAGLAKEADDTLQLIIEAIVSSATDASTAGVGRIAATCVSGIFMVTRRGRDVVIPRFTEMDISLDRPLSLDASSQIRSSTSASGGK